MTQQGQAPENLTNSEPTALAVIPCGVPPDSALGDAYRRRAADIARREVVGRLVCERYEIAQKSQQELLNVQMELHNIHHDIEEDEMEINVLMGKETKSPSVKEDDETHSIRIPSLRALLAKPPNEGTGLEWLDSESAISAVSSSSSTW